ncbi:MAG: DciA family protein [Woeseiaceae bacterium]|nr:DciA family protein [Woeseiaceae bacterium]
MSIIRLEKLLKSGVSDDLEKIVQHAQKLDELLRVLRTALPADSAGALIGASLRDDGELVLICASSAFAARLRYEANRLIETARQAGFMVDRARVTVSKET